MQKGVFLMPSAGASPSLHLRARQWSIAARVGDTCRNQTVVSQVMIGQFRGNNESVTEGWPSRTKNESVILKYGTWHSRSRQADIHGEAPESAQPGGPRDIEFIFSRSHWHMLNSFKLREMYGSTHQSWTPGKLMESSSPVNGYETGFKNGQCMVSLARWRISIYTW